MSPIKALRRWAGAAGNAMGLGRRGVAALEFALVVPVLMLVALGLVDLVNQMRATYRVERMAGEILNALGQIDPLTGDQVKSVLCAANSIGGSNIVTANLTISSPPRTCALTAPPPGGAVHVTALDFFNGQNRRLWSLASFEGAAAAGLGSTLVGDAPVLPGGTTVPAGTQVLAVEVLTARTRWFTWIDSVNPWALNRGSRADIIQAIAVARPRTATLPGTLP